MIEAIACSCAAAIIAFAISVMAIPAIRRVAMATRAVDYPGWRKRQSYAVPRMGGVAAVAGLFAGSGIMLAARWGTWNAHVSSAEMLGIPLAFFIILMCGLLEDTICLSPCCRILMQFAAALLVVGAGWSFTAINIPLVNSFKLGILSEAVSVLWIIGVTNAINLIDGLDGLAGGVVAIIGSSLLVFSFWNRDYISALVMAALVGACFGFLRKNWAPAQIYLGDTGSLTMGFLLAIVSMRSSMKSQAAVAILVPILALGLPVMDTILVMLFRFTKRSSGSLLRRCARMFQSDRSHLHYIMARLGSNRSHIVIALYVIAAAFCGMALLAAMTANCAVGLGLVGVEMAVVIAMRYVGLHSEKFLPLTAADKRLAADSR
jgi:UDP-GlcNAc:undecaprenyl-phosphate/decaprenyl-phosphate GlcNAc-1-phosphate transferase